jgi:hypothetical protein
MPNYTGVKEQTKMAWTKEDQKEYARKYDQENKDRIRQYYFSNRAHFLAYKKNTIGETGITFV